MHTVSALLPRLLDDARLVEAHCRGRGKGRLSCWLPPPFLSARLQKLLVALMTQ
jgi:hypothetical protein